MVGNSMFTIQLNNRLKDIKGCTEDFGHVSIIAVGDLFQLEPVMDGYIFKDLKNLDLICSSCPKFMASTLSNV